LIKQLSISQPDVGTAALLTMMESPVDGWLSVFLDGAAASGLTVARIPFVHTPRMAGETLNAAASDSTLFGRQDLTGNLNIKISKNSF